VLNIEQSKITNVKEPLSKLHVKSADFFLFFSLLFSAYAKN